MTADNDPNHHGAAATRNDQTSSLSGLAWDLDWNLLRTFMVIAREKSITRAANSLGQKQPSVSNALRRLEEKLGFQLAHRDPRNFELTSAGEATYEECRELFGAVGRLPNIARNLSGSVSGHLSIALASHVTSPIFDATLHQFHKDNPEATISLSVKSSQEVLETIRAKQATIGICLLSGPVADLQSNLFYREHFSFYCGPSHQLYGSTDVDLDDLRTQSRVSFYTDKIGNVLQPVARARQQMELSDTVSGVSNNLEEVRRMIIAGLGIGPLPDHVVERDVQNGRLHRLATPHEPILVDVHILHNPKALLNTAETAFMAMLQNKISEVPVSERTYGS